MLSSARGNIIGSGYGIRFGTYHNIGYLIYIAVGKWGKGKEGAADLWCSSVGVGVSFFFF